MSESKRKIQTIRNWMAERKLDGLLLQSAGSFAWATCGAASYINIATTNGAAQLLITHDHQYLITTNIEAPRFEKEEKLASQGWELCVTPWHASLTDVHTLKPGRKLAADGFFQGAVDLSAELARLRAQLSPEEGQRFQALGALSAAAMDRAARQVRPGQTEYEISASLAEEAEKQGVLAVVNLVATDERIFAYRHPLPTAKRLDRYAMLILCGRKYGLVSALTRLVHSGPLPDELKRKEEACARVDEAFISATRPGASLAEVFAQATAAYAAQGFPDEWHKHHQGGACGYEPREFLGLPASPEQVSVGQVYAWNPSITGYKSEDTILVGEDHNQVITEIPGWPVRMVNGLPRPAILVL